MTVSSVQTSSALPPLPLPSDIREDLHDYAEAGGFRLRPETHPWYAALDSVTDQDEARAASTVLAELRGRDLPLLQQAAEHLGSLTGLNAPATVVETATLVALTLRTRETHTLLRPEAYEVDLDAFLAATGSRAFRAERGSRLSWLRRRALAREARRLTTRRAGREELHGALTRAAAERAEWATLTGGSERPVLPTDRELIDGSGPAAEAALTGTRELTRLIGSEAELDSLPLDELAAVLDALAADEGTLYRLPRLHALRARLKAAGLDDLLAELTARQADTAETDALLSAATVPAQAVAEPELDLDLEAAALDADLEPSAEPTRRSVPAPMVAPDESDESDESAEAIAEVEAVAAVEAVAKAEAVAPVDEATPVAETAEVVEIAEAEPISEVAEAAEAVEVATEEPVELAEPAAEDVAEAELATEAEPIVETEEMVEAEQLAAVTEDPADADADLALEEPAAAAEPIAEAEATVETVVEAEAHVAEAEPAVEAEQPAEVAEDADVDLAPEEPAVAAEPVAEAETTVETLVEAEAAPAAEVVEVTEAAEVTVGTDATDVVDAVAAVEAEAAPAAEVVEVTETAEVTVEAGATDAVIDAAVAVETVEATAAEAEVAEEAPADEEAAPPALRPAKPAITPGQAVTAYAAADLEALVRWIDSDGVERTDDELLRAAMKELGFSRLGPRIKEALGAAVSAVRGA